MIDILPVTPDDPTVAFLESHLDSSIFLLFALAQFGPRAGAEALSGNFWRIEEGGRTVGVFCLTRKGDLLLQTAGRTDLALVILDACARETTPLTGVVAEWSAASSIWDVLVESGQVRPVYESNKLLCRLDLNRAPTRVRTECRRLSPDDFEQWDPLYTAHIAEEGAPSPGDSQQRAAAFRRMVDGQCPWWGAFTGTTLVSIVALNAHYRTSAQIAGMYTRAEARGRGHARALMTAVLRDGWESFSLRRVVLLVNEDNTPARRLYKSMGFVTKSRFGFLFGRAGTAPLA
jgi:ribosomal protein S18 acetylase RimI-like enzyme